MKRTNKLSRLAGLIFLMTIMLFIGSCSEKGTATQPGQQLQIKIDTSRMGLASMEQLEYFILTVTGPGVSTPIEGVMVLFEGGRDHCTSGRGQALCAPGFRYRWPPHLLR